MQDEDIMEFDGGGAGPLGADGPLGKVSDLMIRIASAVLLMMMMHVSTDVLTKFFFNYPIKGTLEIVSYYYMVSVVFLPVAFVELTRSAVAVDAVYGLAPRRLKMCLMLLVLAISAAVYAGLVMITWPEAWRSFVRREVVMGPIPVPIWPTRFILPLSAAFGAVCCLWHIVRFCVSSVDRIRLTAVHDADEGAVA